MGLKPAYQNAFFIPKACRLNFEMPKPAWPNIFQGKASIFNKFLKVPVTYIILFTSHAFPQQTHYPSFIDLCLKVEQSLQLYGGKLKACRLLFSRGWSLQTTFCRGAEDHKNLGSGAPNKNSNQIENPISFGKGEHKLYVKSTLHCSGLPRCVLDSH